MALRLANPWRVDRSEVHLGLPPQHLHAWQDDIEKDIVDMKPKDSESDEKSHQRMIELASSGDIASLWHPHVMRSGLVNETDLIHMDGPLNAPLEHPTQQQLSEPPSFNFHKALQMAIKNADVNRKEYIQPEAYHLYSPNGRRFGAPGGGGGRGGGPGGGGGRGGGPGGGGPDGGGGRRRRRRRRGPGGDPRPPSPPPTPPHPWRDGDDPFALLNAEPGEGGEAIEEADDDPYPNWGWEEETPRMPRHRRRRSRSVIPDLY